MPSRDTGAAAPRAGFAPPDWDAPLDTAERVPLIPRGAIVKGMFFTSAIELAARMDPDGARELGGRRYFAFKDYPLAEHVRALEACARLAFPGERPRQGVRLLGRAAFAAFAGSMVGRAVFGIAGRNWDDALRLVTRAYGVTGPVGTAELVETLPARVVIAFRQIWNFPDSYHVGVIEAAMEHYGKRGEIYVRGISRGDVDFELRFD